MFELDADIVAFFNINIMEVYPCLSSIILIICYSCFRICFYIISLLLLHLSLPIKEISSVCASLRKLQLHNLKCTTDDNYDAQYYNDYQNYSPSRERAFLT